MNISEIKIRKTFTDGALRGIVSVTIDDCLAIHDIKVVQGSERLFIAMPSRKDENGIYRDVVHPIFAGAREIIEMPVLDAYAAYVAQMTE